MNRQHFVAFFTGLLFAIGLGIGGMTDPAKVIGFLDFFGSWDPTLVFVMAGAVMVYFVVFRLATKRPHPLLASSFALPTRKDLDARLLAGAALFGLGWGTGGFCPGPAIVSATTGATSVLIFVGAMVAGIVLFRGVERAL